ncbi:MAG: hypothetical protein RL375_1334, partial [Pseudomonadota bacterium]
MQAAISRLMRSAAWLTFFAIAPAQAGDVVPWVARHIQGGIKAELNLNSEQTGAIPLGQPLTLTLTLTD